jgi:tRNA threonylcarbamoyladenosine biosynthesis protein TsaE
VIRAATKSAEDTRELAAAVAGVARAGDVVLLAGDLGAGKTTFAQGFARGLGVAEPVTSPTFVLVRPYEGRLRLAHVDLYRLDHLQEVVDLGLPELVDEGAVVLVEWGDVAPGPIASEFLEVRLTPGEADRRQLDLRLVGDRWRPRHSALVAALGRWAASPGVGEA